MSGMSAEYDRQYLKAPGRVRSQAPSKASCTFRGRSTTFAQASRQASSCSSEDAPNLCGNHPVCRVHPIILHEVISRRTCRQILIFTHPTNFGAEVVHERRPRQRVALAQAPQAPAVRRPNKGDQQLVPAPLRHGVDAKAEHLCGNQIYGTARSSSPRRPPRHRRDACSMAWRCRFLTARRNAPDAFPHRSRRSSIN